MPVPPRKSNLTRDQYAARFKAERARQQQRFCDAFGLWQHCASRHCYRDRGCRGDVHECLKRALGAVPHEAQWRARQHMLDAMPPNIGAPERAARLCMPRDFYVDTIPQAAAEYFGRFAPKRRR